MKILLTVLFAITCIPAHARTVEWHITDGVQRLAKLPLSAEAPADCRTAWVISNNSYANVEPVIDCSGTTALVAALATERCHVVTMLKDMRFDRVEPVVDCNTNGVVASAQIINETEQVFGRYSPYPAAHPVLSAHAIAAGILPSETAANPLGASTAPFAAQGDDSPFESGLSLFANGMSASGGDPFETENTPKSTKSEESPPPEIQPSVVPVPAGFWLLFAGLAFLVGRRRALLH